MQACTPPHTQHPPHNTPPPIYSPHNYAAPRQTQWLPLRPWPPVLPPQLLWGDPWASCQSPEGAPQTQGPPSSWRPPPQGSPQGEQQQGAPSSWWATRGCGGGGQSWPGWGGRGCRRLGGPVAMDAWCVLTCGFAVVGGWVGGCACIYVVSHPHPPP